MPSAKRPIKILYNESHANFNKLLKPQGGPSRFAQGFRRFFLKQKDVRLCPLLFTHEIGAKPFIRKKSDTSQTCFEIVYEKHLLLDSYKKDFTRREYIAYLKPFINVLTSFVAAEKPDVLFLNGFSLTSWLLMYAARKNNVPVVIQHAGIWRKEISIVKRAFSPAIRKIFYGMERDTAKWCAHHIFLNVFCEKIFADSYKKSWKNKKAFSIIPLPIAAICQKPLKPCKAFVRTGNLNIGIVARWDGIKNHRAVLRLASSKFKPSAWRIHSVTRIPNSKTELAANYMKFIQIHEPMQSEKLAQFYRSMDICILPSHFDTLGAVVAESLLVGTPVIISDRVGWVDEFRKIGLADHVVATDISGKKFVNMIDSVLSQCQRNKPKYNQLRSVIRTLHNPEKVYKQYAAVFASLTQ